MNIPPPPILPNLFLEAPWAVVATLGLLGVVLMILASRQADRRLLIAGGVAFILAVGVYLLARFVETGREQLTAATHRLVQSTAPLNMVELRDSLAPNAVASGPGGAVWLQRDQILNKLQDHAGRRTAGSHQIKTVVAQTTGPDQGRTGLAVRSVIQSQMGQQPLHTAWLITWRRGADGVWRAENIQWLEFQNQPPTPNLMRQ